MVSAVAGERLRWGPSATAVNLLQLATLGGIALLTWFDVDPSGHPALLPAAAAIIGGSSIWKAAIDEVAARRITMAVSITMAVAAELGLGEFSTALITTLLVRVTSILEGWATVRGFRSLARPPEQLPTDMDTPVLAAVLPIVERIARGDFVRAPIEHIADRLSRFLVAGGLAAAAVTLLITRDARSAVSVVVVVACGVATSTRVAVLAALGRSLAHSAIVKGGAVLEALWTCDSVVLGSTASVVLPDPAVRAVYPSTDVSVHDLLTAAAIAERQSDHPIGRAIVRSAVEKRLVVREPDSFDSVPGHGIRATCAGEEILVGNTSFVTQGRLPEVSTDPSSTAVFVMRGGNYLGAISLVKVARPDAKRALAALKALGISTHLLIGESRIETEPIARELMIDDFQPDLGPAQKLQRIRDLTMKRQVAAVGDASTDASALDAATVRIASGSTTAGADPRADVILLGIDIAPLGAVTRLARQTHRVILANITATL